MTKQGYPEEHELEHIAKWKHPYGPAYFEYIKDRWHDNGKFLELPDGSYELITGGWSGNEDIIGAMRENYIFWSLWWERSERGGYHKFSYIGG